MLDGLKEIKICTAYELAMRKIVDLPPMAAEDYEVVKPVYENNASVGVRKTVGVTKHSELPAAALAYIARLEAILGVPVDIIFNWSRPCRGRLFYVIRLEA